MEVGKTEHFNPMKKLKVCVDCGTYSEIADLKIVCETVITLGEELYELSKNKKSADVLVTDLNSLAKYAIGRGQKAIYIFNSPNNCKPLPDGGYELVWFSSSTIAIFLRNLLVEIATTSGEVPKQGV
jgi:hypothetical protein